MLRFWQRRKDDLRAIPPSTEGADEGAARAQAHLGESEGGALVAGEQREGGLG